MNLIRKIGDIKKKEKSYLISLGLLAIIIIYSMTYAIWFYSVSNSLLNTLGSISIPSGYLNVTLDSDQPELEISISVSNSGIYEVTNFRVNISLDVEYFENNENVTIREKVFNKTVLLGTIFPYKTYQSIIKGEVTDFNLIALEKFETQANLSRLIVYILDIKVTGNYFYNFIPFEILK